MAAEALPNVYDDPKSTEISRQHASHRRNFGAITVSLAAKEEGADIEWLTKRSFLATLDNRRIQISNYYGAESAVAWSIERDKDLAKQFWNARGISVPPGRKVESPEDALRAQTEIGAAVVVKPVTALGGTGVTVNVSEPEDVRQGFLRAEKSGTGVLVEKYIEGKEYRAHATPEECVGVFQRVLPNVSGDGLSTIRELIQKKNRMRQLSPATRGRPIPLDAVTEGFLRRRGMSLDSIVVEGRSIVVRDVNSLTSGGDTRECLDTVSDDLKQTAVDATAAIPGLHWAGVDIIIEDSTGTPYVMEINTNAMTIGSIFPVFGTPRDLAKILFQKVWSRALPDAEGEPSLPAIHATPLPLSQIMPPPKGQRLSLKNLLRTRLKRRDYEIIDHNRTVWSAESPNQAPLWFGGVRSESDLRIATIPLTNLPLREQLLRLSKVPAVASQNVLSLKELEEFREQIGAKVTLIPANTTRPLTRQNIIEHGDSIDENILKTNRRWVAKEWIDGERFSIIASQEQAFAVIGNTSTEAPQQQLVDEASHLAVSAVRAIPQLNWAVVDVVCSMTPKSEATAIVEQMWSNPTFAPENILLAGSLDTAFDWIIENAH